MSKKILVAGAGGYIGIVLCQLLVKSGYEVIAFDRFFFGRRNGDFELSSTLVIRGDIREIEASLLEHVDAVVDLAGLSNDPAALISRHATYSINYEGACHLARTAKEAGVKNYVYMSSASVYGRSGHEPLQEEAACVPQSLYAELKLKVENSLLALSDTHFQPVMLRNATVFGLAPRMRYDLVVNTMTHMAMREGVIRIDGDGCQQRPFIHVRDVGRAVLLALELDTELVPERIFNVGGDTLNYTIKQIAECVAQQVSSAQIIIAPNNADSRDYCLNFNRAREQLKFTPSIDIKAGIKEIVTELTTQANMPRDPSCFTAPWYKNLMEWEERLTRLSLRGRIL
ncbi:SDR family oxidoreductase [Pseudomonas lijiangensis]|uniref:NAD-dependent epimerase/dehydratase family protein n=1 Tax=Pseudomonas lijiangensis TaxID=2995658 RepID=UPI0031BBA63B